MMRSPIRGLAWCYVRVNLGFCFFVRKNENLPEAGSKKCENSNLSKNTDYGRNVLIGPECF